MSDLRRRDEQSNKRPMLPSDSSEIQVKLAHTDRGHARPQQSLEYLQSEVQPGQSQRTNHEQSSLCPSPEQSCNGWWSIGLTMAREGDVTRGPFPQALL